MGWGSRELPPSRRSFADVPLGILEKISKFRIPEARGNFLRRLPLAEGPIGIV